MHAGTAREFFDQCSDHVLVIRKIVSIVLKTDESQILALVSGRLCDVMFHTHLHGVLFGRLTALTYEY